MRKIKPGVAMKELELMKKVVSSRSDWIWILYRQPR